MKRNLIIKLLSDIVKWGGRGDVDIVKHWKMINNNSNKLF